MSAHIPEDLSQLPDLQPVDSAEAGPQKPMPEDLSDLPEALLPPAETREVARHKRPRPRRLAALLVATLTALATVAVSLEVSRFVQASFEVHAALGSVAVALLVLSVALLGLIVAREVEGYLRLSSFDGMKEVYEGLQKAPRNHELHGLARREVERWLRCLEEFADAPMLVQTRRMRDRMDLAESPSEWREDIERVLLSGMDEQAQEAIRREAVNVGVGTAISPYGVLDAAISVWRNVRLIRRIASIYHVRAGAYGTWLILRRTVASAALADLAQGASVALLGTTRSLASFVGAPLAQGLANATMTVRVGLKAQEQCRPLRLQGPKQTGIVKTLVGSVCSTVRRFAPSSPPADEESAS